MSQQRRGGTIAFNVNGVLREAKGSFTYNLGRPKKEAIIGADKPHGYKEMPQVAFIEGAITDSAGLDLDALVTLTDATVTLTVANGKVISLGGAYYAGEGSVTTEEGEIEVRFEGEHAEEIR